jgi:hypothetical protein
MICFVILAAYVVLGFMLAWIAGMVAKEEVEVKTGVLTLICAGIVSLLARLGIKQILGAGVEALGADVIADLAVLTLMINLIAKLSWKHSIIIAVIYTVVLTILAVALGSCTASS